MKTWQKIKMNTALKEKFFIREKVIDAIRLFFKQRDFHEVETPLLVKYPGTEPYLEVFETQLKFAEGDTHRGFLLTSPEYAMKKLLVAGLGNIFQICKSFRNGEGRSSRHNPEFTILEFYRTDADYTDMIRDVEEMMLSILRCVKKDNSASTFMYQGTQIDLSTPWPRMSVAEAFERYAGITIDQLLSRDELVKVAKQKGYMVDVQTTWEQVYNQLFLNEIEMKLDKTRPTIIYDYPASQAALSLKKVSDPRFAERFECYLAGLELGNAFSELTDAKEQEKRFRAELIERKEFGKTDYGMDEDFIEALKEGMPRSSGIAIGVDRLVMLFADAKSIEETLFFPAGEVFAND